MRKSRQSKRSPRQPTRKQVPAACDGTKAVSTIKDLLFKLSATQQVDGTEITINSLRRTLECIEAITGRDYPAKTSTEISLEESNVIEAMYLASRASEDHFLRMIGPLEENQKPDMERQDRIVEFQDLLPKYRNRGEKTSQVVSDFANLIREQIDVEDAQRIDNLFPNLHEVLETIEAMDRQVLQPLDELEMVKRTEAIRLLASFVAAHQSSHSLISINPLGEALYTHLRTLRFAHHVAGYKCAMESARIRAAIRPIPWELCEFGSLLAGHQNMGDALKDEVHSVASLLDFCAHWKLPLSRLLSAVLGYAVTIEEIPKLGVLAQRVLNIDCYYVRGIHDVSTPTLSTIEIVSALCAVRHELHDPTTHTAYWLRQKSQGTSIINALTPTSKRPLSGDKITCSLDEITSNDLIPHQINQVWFQRLWNVHAAVIDRHDLHMALVNFHLARLETFAQIFRSNDMQIIQEGTDRLQEEATMLAVSLAHR